MTMRAARRAVSGKSSHTVQPLYGFLLSALVALGAAVFATFSLVIACAVKTRERFMGIGQVLTMPLFFASNAIYPLALMPKWLRSIALLNPLTYLVDALRGLMLKGGTSLYGVPLDCAGLLCVMLLLLAIAVRAYPHLVR